MRRRVSVSRIIIIIIVCLLSPSYDTTYRRRPDHPPYFRMLRHFRTNFSKSSISSPGIIHESSSTRLSCQHINSPLQDSQTQQHLNGIFVRNYRDHSTVQARSSKRRFFPSLPWPRLPCPSLIPHPMSRQKSLHPPPSASSSCVLQQHVQIG